MMKKRAMCVAALAIAAGLSFSVPPAKALTYQVDFVGSAFTLSAVVDTDVFNVAQSAVGLVTGPTIASGGALTGVVNVSQLATPPYNAWIWDNLLPGITNGGLLVTTALNILNLYTVGSQAYLSVQQPGAYYNPGDPGTLSVSQVPIPPAVLLFGTALVGLGLLSRRRKPQTTGLAAA